MSQAISRESFDELKNYLGVYLQQGRPLLDSDWNESQDIATALLRRISSESLGEGSPNTGFRVDPIFAPSAELISWIADRHRDDPFFTFEELLSEISGDVRLLELYIYFGPILFFLNFPGDELESFTSLDGFSVSSPQGTLDIGRDRPAADAAYLRLAGHPGTVTVEKTLPATIDLSQSELATYKFRLNHNVRGEIRFFLEDDDANRSVWAHRISAVAHDAWLSGFAAPLSLALQILPKELVTAATNEAYFAAIAAFGGTPPWTFSVSDGSLPAGLTIDTGPTADPRTLLSGRPTANGTFSFTVQVTDADSRQASRVFALDVKPLPRPLPQLLGPFDLLVTLRDTETPTGSAADLTKIRRFGFELYQDSAHPLIWDLAQLRVASTTRQREIGADNFIIRGSQFDSMLNEVALQSLVPNPDDPDLYQRLLDGLSRHVDLSGPSIVNAGRYYVDGLRCLQPRDILYSEQCDPNDPPLAAPAADETRVDTVYLDVWTETVTYVEDPAIREIALGGIDTSTRRRLRHRVRVAQGTDMPSQYGIGDGLLSTEGAYTAQANRLYRVEIDTPGDIGTATLRWSEDNASTIQRIIAPVPPGSQQLLVEDGTAFHPHDKVLLRKEFGAEEHEVASVLGNTIALSAATGTQLARLPAAATLENFTTFALADRPIVQRWNAFRTVIAADPADTAVSLPVALNDGVNVRLGGHSMRNGDFWTFTTRYLAGDDASGLDSASRIEHIDWRRADGVRHHYAPLATMTRHGISGASERDCVIRDRRLRTDNTSTTSRMLSDVALTGLPITHLGGMALPVSALDSRFVIFWSGELFLSNSVPSDSTLSITLVFYDDDLTDPATDRNTGKVEERSRTVLLGRRPVASDIPLRLEFDNRDSNQFAMSTVPRTWAPTSVHTFVSLSRGGFTVGLTAMRLLALEFRATS